MPAQKVCVIVAAFCEEVYIGEMLSSLNNSIRKINSARHGEKLGFYFDKPIVVDDGSPDKTASIASQEGAEVLKLSKNSGKAFAFYTGALRAKQQGADIIVTLDADLKEITPKQLVTLVKPVVNGKKMSIGTVAGGIVTLFSGQRAISIAALAPLFRGNKKWRQYFGIRDRKMIQRTGYGLEEALNICLAAQERLVENFENGGVSVIDTNFKENWFGNKSKESQAWSRKQMLPEMRLSSKIYARRRYIAKHIKYKRAFLRASK